MNSENEVRIRNSQAIHTYGPGSISNFPELSLMILTPDAEPDAWGKEEKDLRIVYDERLAEAFNVSYFIMPPIIDRLSILGTRFPASLFCPKCRAIHFVNKLENTEPRIDPNSKPAKTFDSNMSGYVCPDCYRKIKHNAPRLVPSRFIIATEEGFIDDFPWDWYVHRKKPQERGKGHKLFLEPKGKSASLKDIYIISKKPKGTGYTEIARESLEDIFNQGETFIKPNYLKDPSVQCKMPKPWLGKVKRKDVKTGEYEFFFKEELISDVPDNPDPDNLFHKRKFPRTLQRGAGNVYFPVVYKGISIPIESYQEQIPVEVVKYIKRFTDDYFEFDDLHSKDELSQKWIELLDNDKFGIKIVSKFDNKYTLDQIKTFVGLHFSDEESPNRHREKKKQLRLQEFKCFTTYQNDSLKKFWYKSVILEGQRLDSELNYFKSFIDKVVLLEKLKELKIFRGFTRVKPLMFDDLIFARNRDDLTSYTFQLEYDRIQDARKDPKNTEFLPCSEDKGEGIFLHLNNMIVEEWANRPSVRNRIAKLNKNYNHYFETFNSSNDSDAFITLTARYVFLHTFAHILIQELAQDSGYNNASLSEIIYCSDENDQEKMNGILIYTSSSDAEGTLGGLVEKGNPVYLSKIIQKAVERASWCSSDPLCIETDQGQGFMGLNLAACYSCVLLPETSCENMNRFLDRALLVGTLENPEIGFFPFLRNNYVPLESL